MRAKELQDWFPEARISDQPVEKEGYLTLPLASQQWILLEEAGLSEREKQLVALLTQQEQARSLNPWYSYLVEGKGQAPQVFKKIQLVYCHLSYFQQENLASWLDMMRTLFSNCQTVLQVGAQDYVFVLQQDKYTSVRDILSDTIEAVEYDFGLRLSIMLGQVWSQTGHQALSDLIKAERDLFKTWWRQGHQGVHTFSQLYLWSMGERLVDLKRIKECLHQMILDQDQIQEIILSLWENSAVLTKTAQQLYLHRNSLQYKIDKWEELTGLQLKELTDLTLCYQLILGSLSTIVGL
ncbi:TPA: helix-turn-helix domain-containing protein [Streptococcus pneumoniae]